MADLQLDDVLGVLGTSGDVSRETPGMPQDERPKTPLNLDDVSGVITDMEKARTQQSVFKGVREDPDTFAKDRATADRSGLPVEAVRQDRQNVESSLKVEDVMGLIEGAPVTKAFMQDENNAKIAHDDVENLTFIEKSWDWFTKDLLGSAADVARGVPSGVVSMPGMTLSGLGETYTAVGRSLARPIYSALDAIGADDVKEALQTPLPWFVAPGEILRRPGEAIRAIGEDIAPEERTFATDVGMGVGQIAAQITAAILTGGASSYTSLVTLAGQGASIQADMVKAAGAQGTAAGDLAIMAGGPITAITERYGLDALLKYVPSSVKSRIFQVVAGAGTEGSQEIIEQVLQNLTAYSLYDPEQTIFDASVLYEGGVGATVGALASATIGGGSALRNSMRMRQAQKAKEKLLAANEAAMNSKLNSRDPARAAAHRAEVLRAQGIETVSIDAEAASTFFQEYMAQDSNFIENLGITQQELSEASAIGGDIEISVDAFAEHLYGTERFNDIADYVRLGDDTMTSAEAAQYEETGLQEEISKLDTEISGMEATTRQDADIIRSEVEQMMTEAGQAGDAARFAGSLLASEYATVAERAGISALDLWKQDRVSILGPESATRGPIDNLTILLDKARTTDVDAFLGLSKMPAMDMLIEQGGVDPSGSLASELEVLGVTNKTKPGLFRKGGLMTADNLVQAEQSLFADMQVDEDLGGYIPVDEIVAAVREELAGAPRRTIEQTAAQEAFGADIENLMAVLDEAGLTLDATDAEIRAALDATTFEQEGKVPRLSALHNISSDNLIFADKMGGLAAPSIGVVTEEMGMEAYGDITMIGDVTLADPEKVDVFDADAYTSTFPRAEYKKVKVKIAQKLVDEIRPWDIKYNGKETFIIDATWDNAVNTPNPDEIINKWMRDNATKAMFLEETTGKVTRPVTRSVQLSDEASKSKHLIDFFAGISDDVWRQGANSPEQVQLRKDIRAPFEAALHDKYSNLDDADHIISQWIEGAFNENGEMHLGPFDRLKNDQKNVGKKEVDKYEIERRLDKKLKGKEAAFQKWVTDKVMAIFGEPHLTLRGKKVEYSLDNIVDYMTHQGVQAKEDTMTFGGGKARAVAAKKFTSLDWMRNEAEYSLKHKSELEDARKEAETKLEKYRDAALEYYTNKNYRGKIDTWNGLDDSMKAIAHWAKNKQRRGSKAALKEGLRRNDFRGVPGSVIDLGIEAGEAMLYAPVPYFEAKPQRAVGLGEFAGAVVPNDVSPDVVEILDKHGIPYRKYGSRYDEDARIKAVVNMRKRLAKSGKQVLFQEAAGPLGQQVQRAFVFNDDGTMTLKMTKKEVEFLATDANEFVDAAPSLKIEGNVLIVNQDELDSLGDFILDIKAAYGPGAVPPRIRKFFQAATEGPRGSITFDTRETIIRMFEAADKSTFLHESGHLFLDHVKRNAAQFGEATPQFIKDWDTVKMWWGKNAEALRGEAIKYARAKGDTAAVTALGEMSDKAVTDYVRSGNLTGETELYQGATGDVASGAHKAYLTRAMHEQWARGVEDYFRTGQAPSIGLQDAFNRFRAWLVSVYSAATRRGALDVQLPQDVKEVLDRLLASDEEIALVEEQYNLKAFFESAQEAGMTKSQWAAYQHEIGRASEDAKTRQLKKHLNDIEREQLKWWKEESNRIRETVVEPDVHTRPVYKVMYGLARGTSPDGTELEGGMRPSRLDRKAVVALLENEASLKRLPKIGATGLIATGKEGGAHPDVIAQIYGYEDGRVLLVDLMNAIPMKDVIAAETEARMKAEFGDMQDNVQAVNEALESVHADKRGEVLAMELNALRESGAKMKPAFVRQWAREKIGAHKVDAIRADKFLAAERKHAREAGRLLRAGDRLGAQQAKFRQIMNFYMAKEAYKERAKIDKSRRYLDKFNRPKKTFKGLDADYLDKIRLIMEAYELGPRLTDRKQTILELQAMNDWINAKEEDDGAILHIPARILAANEKTHYRDLTLDEYRELVDSVRNIEQQGRLKKTALISGEKRLIDDMAGEIVDRLDQLPQSKRVMRKALEQNPGALDRAVGKLATFDASLRKVEFLTELVDGEKMGPTHRYLFDVFADAEHNRNDMSKNVTSTVMAALDDIPKDVRGKLAEKIDVPELGRTFRRSDLLMMALNSGNESNLSKMIEGSEKDVTAGAQAWTQDGVDIALANLTKEEWDFVQTVWDAFEGMYPEVEAIYKRENGVAPERVEPRKIETAYGEYAGGYFPMMYDPERSAQAREIEGKSAIEAMQSVSFKGSVNSSMTKARTGFSAPVLLNIEALPNHIERTAHFITHYEAVRSTRKLLAHPEIVRGMTNKLGPEYFDAIKHWVNELAANGQPSNPTSITGKIVESMRTNATVAIMGFSYTTMASQILGYANSTDALAKQADGSYSLRKASKWLSIGLVKYLSNPLAAKREIFAASGEMRHRLENTDREIRHGLKKLAGKKGAWKSMQRASLLGIAGVQVYVVDFPTWIGAYNKGLSEGVSDPVRYADSVLRMSQTAGGIKDLAEIQRERGVTTALTMFYSYFSLLYNMEAQAIGDVKATRNIPQLVARAMVLLVLPTAAEAVMRNQWPDDDEDYGTWLALKASLYGLTSVPFLRDLVGLAEGFGYSMTPLDGLGESLGRSISGVARAIDDGDVTEGTIKATVATFGFATGAPVTAVNRIVDASAAILDGEDVGPYDFLIGHKKN